ncbi:MAG: hypothetical protein ACLFTT_01370 [Candidatus Hydrogenedentota bacterium]
MGWKFVSLAGVVLAAACTTAQAATVTLDADGMAVINGTRTFLIGLYEIPKEDALLEEVAEAGFNLVRSRENVGALDRLHEVGVWAWINTGMKIDFSVNREDREALVRKSVDALGEHPALAVWEVPDEALWNTWYRAQTWREQREPRQLAERIDGIEEQSRRDALRGQLRQSRELREFGEYAKAERIADKLWEQLDEAPPEPDLNMADAPERAAKLAEGLYEGYRFIKRLDPVHLVWMNHAPRNQIEQLAAFNRAADVVGCDIYPVPRSQRVRHSDIADQTVAAVGAYTERMQAAAPDKPVWMVLQGFGWGDLFEEEEPEVRERLRRPTKQETRFMAFDAIVHGARAIFYWGTTTIEKDVPFWKELLEVVSELDELQPVLSAPEADLPVEAAFAPTFGSVDRGIVVLAKDAPDGVCLIVVNEWTSPLTYTLEGLDSLDGTVYQDTATERASTVEAGALTLPIPAQSVHVLRPQP